MHKHPSLTHSHLSHPLPPPLPPHTHSHSTLPPHTPPAGLGQGGSIHQRSQHGAVLEHRTAENTLCPGTRAEERSQYGQSWSHDYNMKSHDYNNYQFVLQVVLFEFHQPKSPQQTVTFASMPILQANNFR